MAITANSNCTHANAEISLPGGWRKMDTERVYFFGAISCRDCKVLLKPERTRKATQEDRDRFGQHVQWV